MPIAIDCAALRRFFLLPLALAALAPMTAGSAPSDKELQDPILLQQQRAAGLAKKAGIVYYTKKFDLSGLPEYKPRAKMSGTLRQWGSNYLADSMLEGYLEAGFKKYHPDVKFETSLKSTFLGMAGLYADRADLAAMGRRPTWDELQGYQRVFETMPVEIVMATGSYDVGGWTFALVPFVHKDNPLAKMTLKQLDGIFGAERNGGWDGNEWVPSRGRGKEDNIRTWGQLGLTGEWADKPIHVYAYNLNYHFPRDFAEKVMKGGYKWNEGMVEFSNVARPRGSAGEQLIDALTADKYGITYASMLYKTADVKPLALASSDAGPFVMPTIETVHDRSYPLSREVYYYTNRAVGKKIDPLVTEYLRFVLSREGQEAVQRDGKYLPLTAEIVRGELAKLDQVGVAGKAAE